MTNAAHATSSFNNNPISSPLTVALVRYKQPTKKEEHNEEEHIGDKKNYGGPGYGGYGGAVIPMIPGPMYDSPMFSSEPNGYSSVPNRYGNVPDGYSSVYLMDMVVNPMCTPVDLLQQKYKIRNLMSTKLKLI